MRLPRTLSLYVLREVAQYAGIGLLGLASVLLVQNVLQELNDLVGLGARGGEILRLVGILLVGLGSYTLPIAFLFGILLAIGRLSGDGEVTAMRALGVSLGQLLAPVLVLGIAASLVTAWLQGSAEPTSRREMRALLGQIASRGGIIQPGTFNELDHAGKRLIFVDTREDSRVQGVLIADHSDPKRPFTVVAESGEFGFDDATSIAHLRLHAGDIDFEPADTDATRYQRISFEEFDYAFDMSRLVGAGYERLLPRDMSTRQLREALAHFDAHGTAPPGARVQQRNRYEIELYERLVMPFAPLLFALIGVPLGHRRSRGGRSIGVLICVALAFLYYMLLSGGTFLAQRNMVPAAYAMWIPNATFGLAGAWLLWRGRGTEA